MEASFTRRRTQQQRSSTWSSSTPSAAVGPSVGAEECWCVPCRAVRACCAPFSPLSATERASSSVLRSKWSALSRSGSTPLRSMPCRGMCGRQRTRAHVPVTRTHIRTHVHTHTVLQSTFTVYIRKSLQRCRAQLYAHNTQTPQATHSVCAPQPTEHGLHCTSRQGLESSALHSRR